MTTWNATTIAAGDYSALPTLPGVLVGQEYGYSEPGRPAPTGTVWVPIQRDDEADIYPDDEDAANAYARAVGAPPDPDTGQPLTIWSTVDVPSGLNDGPDDERDAEPADVFVAVPIGATIDDRGVVELPPSSPLATVCGSCGRGWRDEVVTSWTPAPGGRCPFEYDHPDEDEDEPDPEREGQDHYISDMDACTDDETERDDIDVDTLDGMRCAAAMLASVVAAVRAEVAVRSAEFEEQHYGNADESLEAARCAGNLNALRWLESLVTAPIR